MLSVTGYIEGGFGLRYPSISLESHDKLGRTRPKWSQPFIVVANDDTYDDEIFNYKTDYCECHPVGHKYPIDYFTKYLGLSSSGDISKATPSSVFEISKVIGKKTISYREDLICVGSERFVRKKDSAKGALEGSFLELDHYYNYGSPSAYQDGMYGIFSDGENNQWVLVVPVFVVKKIKTETYVCKTCNHVLINKVFDGYGGHKLYATRLGVIHCTSGCKQAGLYSIDFTGSDSWL